jgi:hypothetical protein
MSTPWKIVKNEPSRAAQIVKERQRLISGDLPRARSERRDIATLVTALRRRHDVAVALALETLRSHSSVYQHMRPNDFASQDVQYLEEPAEAAVRPPVGTFPPKGDRTDQLEKRRSNPTNPVVYVPQVLLGEYWEARWVDLLRPRNTPQGLVNAVLWCRTEEEAQLWLAGTQMHPLLEQSRVLALPLDELMQTRDNI